MSDAAGSGLFHALLLDGAGGARGFDAQALSGWSPDQGSLWVHVDLGLASGRDWIERESGLDEVAAGALLAQDTRPRAVVERDELLLALRGVNLNPGQEPEDMVAIRIWCDGQRIVSSAHRRLITVQDLVDALAAGRGPARLGALLAQLAEGLIERLGAFVEGAENAASEIDEAAVEDAGRERRTELAELRRQAITIRRFLSPQRDALTRLPREPLSWLTDEDRDGLRETQNHLQRLIEDLDAVRDRASVTQEQIRAELTEQLNRRMYVLAIITAIFLPMSFLTGLFGVNLGGIPGASSEVAFALFVAGLVAIAVIVAWAFTRSRWL